MFSPTLMDEVMAHSIYVPDDDVGFDSQSKRDVLSISTHAGRGDSYQDMVDRAGCQSPSPEVDSKSRNSTRRRIQVACNRCRKRKIKCSGDNGDGQGCTNCRNSGNANCQFLRVNSSMMQPRGTWPYPSANATISPSHRHGHYAQSNALKTVASTPPNASNMRVSPFPRGSGYGSGPNESTLPFSRQLCGIDHAVHYEEDSDMYSPQSSGYMDSGAPQAVIADYCGLTWSPKPWSSNVYLGRSPSPTMFAEKEGSSSFPQPPFSYIFSGPPNQITDGPPIVPTMSTASVEGQGVDRTLPNPTSRTQGSQCPADFSFTPEALTFSDTLEHRTGAGWNYKYIGPSDILSSVQRLSNEVLSGSSIERARTSVQDMAFGTPLLTTIGAHSALASSAVLPAGLETATSSDEFCASSTGRTTRPLSQDDLAVAGSDVYVYSSSERRDKHSYKTDEPASVLMSGLPYTRPGPGLYGPPITTSPVCHPDTVIYPAPVPPLHHPSDF
ncbi:uncharacterized protein BP01DRAFT_139289 [Aspergillus saccharolyticus JOP 1030-1]|uniref:Zn(2)-C6 fungal-type domain-containing protein n=1 Tax=Aspergillus saccharolyticus JOP 1030-1 TaxID=1450539 RepID=A0A318ZBY9_9EURO|nr:hypothetical protein BP01DRAFT_139289 [Aspergillus saccharolyticus JOP 1030-1]PYH42203.1 hypothetical protein BP01DRAFT_139289 [Aspergillus saccharolyticus JOP 1030-1]